LARRRRNPNIIIRNHFALGAQLFLYNAIQLGRLFVTNDDLRSLQKRGNSIEILVEAFRFSGAEMEFAQGHNGDIHGVRFERPFHYGALVL
jgi:hypothetical protein